MPTRRLTRRSILLAAAAALSLGACSPAKQDAQLAPASPEPQVNPSTASARVPGAPEAGGSAPATAAPAAARTTLAGEEILGSATSVEPSGRVALEAGRETVVDPAATFEVDLFARSADARIVLLDARDALVAATSAREVAAARTRLTLAPAAPLTPGSRYVLRIDGAATRELHDARGQAYEPIAHQLLAAGTPPPPEQKKKKPARRRRR